MADPYMGEIRLFAGSVAPTGWALCNGQELSIRQYTALYSILSNRYGGDGVTNFQLPNLQGRVPLHPGQGDGLSTYTLGQSGGDEGVVLGYDQLPSHGHSFEMPVSGGDGINPDPTNAYLANSGANQYAVQPSDGALGALVDTQPAGIGRPHPNRQPSLCVNFIIAVNGQFPPHPQPLQ